MPIEGVEFAVKVVEATGSFGMLGEPVGSFAGLGVQRRR